MEKETIAISRFKATALAVMRRVKRTGRPVVVTRFGEPVAEIVPPRAPEGDGSWMGSMAGRARVVGDVVEPVAEPGEWEAIGE